MTDTLHRELRAKLRGLYAKAQKAAGPHSLAAIEREIAKLETEAAEILT